MSADALALVKALMTLPDNAVCADCKKKATKWASSTLGVFICIDCSGIHRSLGTHISFVRSCTLDSWTPEQARIMKRVGNKVANAFWEATWPMTAPRPNPCDRAAMELFIRAKYASRKWVAPGEPPHVANGFSPPRTHTSRSVRTVLDYNPGLMRQQEQPKVVTALRKVPIKSVSKPDMGRPRGSIDMGLFLKGMTSGSTTVDDDGADASGESTDASLPADPIMEPKEAAAEPVPNKKPMEAVVKPVEAAKPVEALKPAPEKKPVQRPVNNDFPVTGSTAHDIMMGGGAPEKKKRAPKTGPSRFAKKATSDV